MKKNDFIYPAIFLAIVILLFVIPVGAFLTAEIVGFKTVKSVGDWIYVFLKDQGSLIAGIIAFVAAVIALYSQRESTQKQIKAQRTMEEEKLFRAKIEETYSLVEGLRLRILLARARPVEDITRDISVFNYDLAKILMLYNLYVISTDGQLFTEYRRSVSDFLESWITVARKYINMKNGNKEELAVWEEVCAADKDAFEKFISTTDDFIVHLSSIGHDGDITIIR